jgi:hypothetical protein
MRQAAGHGEGTDIYQGLYAVGLEDGNKFIERAGGMADGVKGSH